MLEAPVRNVEVKEGAHPSDSGGKYEKVAVPNLLLPMLLTVL